MKKFVSTYYRLALKAQKGDGGGLGAAIVIYLGLDWFLSALFNFLKLIRFLVPVAIILQIIIKIYCYLGIIVAILVYFDIIKTQ